MKDKFIFNPFSGINDNEIAEVIVPAFDVEQVIQKIERSDSLLVEFRGRRGRGKTTHLKYLSQHFPSVPYLEVTKSNADLNINANDILNHPSEFLFIDGIYHFNPVDRVRIFKNKPKIVYTCHIAMVIECFLANKPLLKIAFSGIDKHKLQTILNNRMRLMSDIEEDKQTYFTLEEAEHLIKKYGDNYRAIIHHLYSQYQL